MRVAEIRKSATGRRPWRCLLCPERGFGADEKETLAAFEKHYAARHLERAK